MYTSTKNAIQSDLNKKETEVLLSSKIIILNQHLTHFSQCTLHLPLENIRKPSDILMFSGGRERVHSERMVSWQPSSTMLITETLRTNSR